MNIHFFLSENEGKTATIYVRCFKGQRYLSTTGQRIPKKYWNEKKGTVFPSSAELIRLKEHLESLELDLETFMIEPRSKAQFKERVRRVMNVGGNGFKIALDEFVSFKEKTLAKGSSSKYRMVRNHLGDFEEMFDITPDFPIINQDFSDMFYTYFTQIDQSPNYAGRLVKALKTFMKWAKKNSFHSREDWQDMKAKAVKMPVNFMYGDEILHFANYPLVGAMADVRDEYIVGVFTALRYSDQQRIEPGHNQVNGMSMSTAKDQDEVIIPIPDICRTILDRHGWQLPSFTLYEYNKYLRMAAKEAGLDRLVRTVKFERFKKVDVHAPLHEVISSHMARRTYVTMRIALGDSDALIIQRTGHSSTDAMKPYKGLVTEEMAEKYRPFWAA